MRHSPRSHHRGLPVRFQPNRIVSAKVLPERSKGGYGVLFEFSDGWVEACFHMTERRSRTPDTADRRERSCADLCGSIEARDVTVMPMLRVTSWSPSGVTHKALRGRRLIAIK